MGTLTVAHVCTCHFSYFFKYLPTLWISLEKGGAKGIRPGKSRCGPRAHEIKPAMPQLSSGHPPTSEFNRSSLEACYGGHGYTWVIAPDRQKMTH